MAYFYFILFYFIFMSTRIIFSEEKYNTYYIISFYFIAVVVALLVGLRGNQDEYSILYFRAPSLDVFFAGGGYLQKEYLFELIISLLKEYLISPQYIYLIFSSSAVMIYAVFFRKFTNYYYVAFLFYLSVQILNKEMSGLRLGFVSAMVLPMIYFIANKKYHRFMFVYLVSCLIHYVSFLSIFLLYLNKKIGTKSVLLSLVGAIVIHLSGGVGELFKFLTWLGYMPLIVEHYLQTSSYVYDAGIFNLKLVQQVLVLVFFSYFISKYNIISNMVERQYFNLIFNTYLFSTTLMIIFAGYAIFSFRFAAHFAAVEPIIISYLIWFFKEKTIVTILMSILLVMIGYINYVFLDKLSDYEFLLT